MDLTRNQVDKLGGRLRRAVVPTGEDLRLLDLHERSFLPAADHVNDIILASTGLLPSARPLKTSRSIIAKLRRQPIGLSIMQDIAGSRIIAGELSEQDRLVSVLSQALPTVARIDDLREHPSWGYRAVHIVVEIQNRRLEIQVRTELQHLWAQISERLAQRFGVDLKYGGGPTQPRQLLQELASLVRDVEVVHSRLPTGDPDRATLKTGMAVCLETILEAVHWYGLER